MGKATILEAQNSNTVYEAGKQSGILGKLKGIFADYKNGTRNADRHYTEELWDNRVFGSEDVMEALQTKTLFGELDHPEGDRCETLAQNAAITITKLEKRPEEGVIYGEAEILDTPTGRIVKALADSGAQLGISSRGMGEEIYENGQNIIDPNTYDFITFDVVVTPANTKARVSLTESKHLSKLTESLEKEVKECETANQLNQVKTVLKSINTTNKEDLLNLVESKLSEIDKPVVNEKLVESNKALALKILKESLEESNKEIEELKTANSQLINENKQLIKKNEFLIESRTVLQSKIKENNNILKEAVSKAEHTMDVNVEAHKKSVDTVNKLLQEKKDLESKLATALKENKSLNNKLITESKEHADTLSKLKVINNRKLENVEKQCKEASIKLEENNKELTKKLEANSKLLTSKLEENKQLVNKVQLLEQKEAEHNKKLLEAKTQEKTKVQELQEQLNKVNAEKQQLIEAQDRFSRLAFNPVGTVKAVAENFVNEDMSEEDIQLFNALTGK